MSALPPLVEAWRSEGRTLSVGGLRVFVREVGDAPTTVLLLHGFPSSSSDWRHILPVMATRARLVALDFPGFGLSDKPDTYSYSLFEQADVVEGVAAALGVTAAHVVAHDMATSIACEVAARHERGLLGFRLRSLVLMNSSILMDRARLTLSQRLLRSPLGPAFARLSTRRTFTAQLRRTLALPVPDEELEAMWAQLQHGGGVARMARVVSYLDERRRFHERWIGGLGRLAVPALVLWGDRDPVGRPAVGSELARRIPGARLEWLSGVGHYPQLEAPERTAAALLRHLDRCAAPAEPTGADSH